MRSGSSQSQRKAVAYAAGGAFLLLVGALYDRPSLCLLGAVPLFLVALQSRGTPLAAVEARRAFDPEVRRFEGDEVPVELEVVSRTRATRLLEVRDELPPVFGLPAGSNYGVVALRRGRTARLTYTVASPRFGLHSLGPVRVRAEDPFGFTVTEAAFGGTATLRVEPRPADLEGAEIRSLLPQAFLGHYEVSQPGSGFDFFGLRDYNRADRMRDVNWRATARIGNLIVNQHVRESKADILLLLDARATELAGDPVYCPWAQSGRVAVQIAEELLRRRDSLRIATYGARLSEVRHTGHGRQFQGLVDILLVTTPNGDLPLSLVVGDLLPTISPKSPVILFSSLLEDASAGGAILDLLARGNPVIVVVPHPKFPAGTLAPHERLLLLDREVLIEEVRGYGAIVVPMDPPAEDGSA